MSSALQKFTKQKSLYGQDDQNILDNFMHYASLCSDPHNIFKFMQEKSICIYLANFWIKRTELFVEMGDFKDACVCLKQTISRNHIVNENEVQLEEHIRVLKEKILRALKRKTIKKRRSAEEYDITYAENDNSFVSFQKLSNICEEKYPQVKTDLLKQFNLKQHGKPKSWLDSVYEKKQEKMNQIEEKIKSMTNHQNFLSMRTPITKRDPMRLTKTMDSIQMAKRKRSTKSRGKNQENSEMKPQSDSDEMDDEDFEKANTTPVGRQLTELKKVHFKSNLKIQKIRSQVQNEENEMDYKQNSHKLARRGSILKRSSTRFEDTSMDQQNDIL